MNRTIKFRVWDLGQDKFIDLSCGHHNQKLNDLFKDGSFVFQQFTGLTDKNGTEIFEGDIISYHIPWNGETVVRQIKFDATFLQFTSCDKNNAGIFLYELSDMKDIVVVGNIFENSELLK